MSLESEVINLTNEVRAFTGAVNGQIPQIRAEQQSFTNNWGVDGYKVLEVGAGKTFANLADAYNSLYGKMLKADVLIKVSDGQYSTSGYYLDSHPQANRIRIEGNVANPANCVINCVPTASGLSSGVVFRGVRGLNFSGFKISGACNTSNFTMRGLRTELGSFILSEKSSIIIDGCANGIEVDANSFYASDSVVLNNIASIGLSVVNGSSASVYKLAITGLGANSQITAQGNTVKPRGIVCTDNARVWAGTSTINNVEYGAIVQAGGYLWGDYMVIGNVVHGLYADYSGIVLAQYAKVTNASGNGYIASIKSSMLLNNSMADTCINGFNASTGSTIVASNSYAKNCTSYGYVASAFGQIDAYNTSVNSTNCATKYSSPTSDALANANGMVRFS